MQGDFPERLREWKAEMETSKAATEEWEKNVREARKQKVPPPLPPAVQARREPQAPRLQQTDVTIERVASLLAGAAPKGLLICRDELAGWYLGMNSYNDAGRQFWIEAYGGRFYRVERQKHPEPIDVPRLVVAVTGGTQPEKLAALLRDPDDGLLARMLWAWPEPLPFRLGKAQPAIDTAIEALDRLRCLDMAPGANPDDKPTPIMVRLHSDMLPAIETFGQDMQARQAEAAGLMRSAYGKARGVALRLSLVLEMLRWCIDPVGHPEPRHIGEEAFLSACDLVEGYFLPMAERVYGDAAANPASRNVSTLARWILRTKPIEVHVRTLQRKVRLPGLRDANAIRQAADELVAADWLRPPVKGGYQERSRGAYSVNPALLEASP
jgi:hypothetical protein